MDPRCGALMSLIGVIGRSTQRECDPRRFLDEFSDQIEPLIPHDRLVIHHLDDAGLTFTVFAERAVRGPVIHTEHSTTAFDPEGRYVVAEWAIRPAFAGRLLPLRRPPRPIHAEGVACPPRRPEGGRPCARRNARVIFSASF